MIERGELRLPEMQRRYVWRSTRVRDLVDSLYRGYPSGAILIWETDDEVPLQEFAITQADNPYGSTRLLLDGQQRLTSLAAVIRGRPVKVRNRKKPIDLLFNLEHPERLEVVTEVDEDQADDEDFIHEIDADSTEDELERRLAEMTFVVATRKLERRPHWVKVSEVFRTNEDAPFLKRAGVEGFEDPRYTKYSQRLARLRNIRNYLYRMDVLERTLPYEEVTEIFVRVNSLGAKLRGSDLALAQITAKWRNSLQVFEQYQQECASAGFEIELAILLRNMIAFATGQSRFLTVGGLTKDQLEAAWKLSRDGMDFAINFLKSNAEIDSPALLSSPFPLVALAYLGHKSDYRLDPDDERRLRFWVLIANAKARYSRGSSETILDQDLATIRDGGSIEALVDRLRLQAGRLAITPEDLEGRNQRSALFKTMFLAFRAAGAKDWHSNLAIRVDHSGSMHKLQFHHIFPKKVLSGSYTTRERDDVANLAFLAGRTNRSISAKPPAEYFPPLLEKLGREAFDAQCVPTEEHLLDVANYKEFLAERRQRIADRLNTFLGVPKKEKES